MPADNSPPAPAQTLAGWIAGQDRADASLKAVVLAMAAGCAEISGEVARGALGGLLGVDGHENVQGEVQKTLDIVSNDLLVQTARASGQVAAVASEELEDVVVFDHGEARGRHLLLFDPLDGSSNIDVNVSIGTIFSVLPAPVGRAPVAADFLQAGRAQQAAGYAVYGPQTTLVVSVGEGVAGFTLDPRDGAWRLVQPRFAVPEQTREFAINMSNERHWDEPVRRYITACLAGRDGPRGKDFNMRWVASMVADVHRILTRGGVFLYPWDAREPERAGKLRLMYEANPMALLLEQAGGAASDGTRPILDIAPEALHQRVAVVLGSREEVEMVVAHQRVEAA